MIDIHQPPPTKAVIQEKQNGMTTGTKVAFFCPIPVIDLLAGLATDVYLGDQKAPWQYARGAVDRDWSSHKVTKTYVDRVRCHRRDLVVCEVEALDVYVSKVGTVIGVAEDVSALIKKHFIKA